MVAVAGAIVALSAGLVVAQSTRPRGCEARVEIDCSRPDAAFAQAEELGRRCDDQRKSRTYHELARCLFESAKYLRALEAATLAWNAAETTTNQDLKTDVRRQVFGLLYEVGDYRSAEMVLRDIDSVIDPTDRGLQAWLSNARGLLNFDQGRFKSALRFYRSAKKHSNASPNQPGWYHIGLNLIWANAALGNRQAARRVLDGLKARLPAKAIGSTNPSWTHARAQVAYLEGRFHTAEKLVLRSLQDSPKQTPDWTSILEETLGSTYEARGDFTAAANAYGRAISHVERLRDETLINDFKAELVRSRRRAYEGLFRVELKTRGPNAAIRIVERLKGRVFIDALSRVAPQNKTTQPRFSVAAMKAQTHELFRTFSALSHSRAVPMPPFESVLQSLKGTPALVYFRSGEHVYVLASNGGQWDSRKLDEHPNTLDKLIRKQRARPSDLKIASRLGKALFPPGTLPKTPGPIYIVPDDTLDRVPFMALIADGQRVSRRHQIAVIPSIGTLDAILSRTKRAYDKPVVLAFGRDLPRARDEAAWVAKHLRAAASFGAQATLDAVRSGAKARVLHLAVHSDIGAQRPWLQLADGQLQPSTIIEMQLQPKLAVLASCASARSSTGALWGSLSAALLASGTQSVVSTLWTVDDEVSRAFVEKFYEADGAALPLRALVAAQAELEKAGYDAETWAAFVYLGAIQ